MEWSNEPATWKQLKYLRGFGYQPNHPLTKAEAAALISNYGGTPEPAATAPADTPRDPTKLEARNLRARVEDAKRNLAGAEVRQIEKCRQDLAMAATQREEFWLDTCRDSGRMLTGSTQVQDFYQRHGCRFIPPAHQDVQYILDALDSASPDWDRDHPELFYQTLELNFPHLLHHQ